MTGDHLGLSVSVTKKRVSKGVLPKGAISPDSIKTRHKTKPANFYLYKCSHCLCSQACTCSCKSQECWYSWHLCDNHDFHPCIHQFLEEVENIKLQRKHNYAQKNEVKACVANYTITNAPISCVARPARAVIWARNVGTVRIYMTVMTSILAFFNFWRK